jgi:hypothetical protein
MLIGLLACSGTRHDGLRGATNSLEDAAQRLVAALEQGDENGLVAQLIDWREHDQLYWPALPDSNQVGATDPGFAFENMYLRSLRDLRRTESDLKQRHKVAGALRLRFQSAKAEEVTTYPGLKLHRRVQIRVQVNDGPAEALPLSGSVVERDGHFKFLSYRR